MSKIRKSLSTSDVVSGVWGERARIPVVANDVEHWLRDAAAVAAE